MGFAVFLAPTGALKNRRPPSGSMFPQSATQTLIDLHQGHRPPNHHYWLAFVQRGSEEVMPQIPPLDVSTICTNRRFGDMRYKRIVVTQYGGPDVLTTTEEEIPAPKAGEVRVKVLAAGVGLPDVLAREGVHPETPRLPYTPGWDLVGTVDQLGQGVTGFELRQAVAAMPIHGCYAQYLCLPWRKLVPVPAGLESAEAVAVVLNYITAYQMLHRSAKARVGQRMLIHGAAGGVGSAMLQLAKLAGVEMFGTCSAAGAAVVRELGGIPIDYKKEDFVREVHRLTGDGVDAVFDGIGGDNLWRSRNALREGGRVVTCGFQAKNARRTDVFAQRGASSLPRVR